MVPVLVRNTKKSGMKICLVIPYKTVTKLFSFLGVDCDESIVRKCAEDTRFEKLSIGRKKGEEDRNSHFFKRCNR